jgi:hypothetical protein
MTWRSEQLCLLNKVRREVQGKSYWLRLLDVDGELKQEREQLSTEAQELMNIFGAIFRKSE